MCKLFHLDVLAHWRQALGAVRILVGDFVVIESTDHDGRRLARKIMVVGARPASGQYGLSS